MCYLKFPRDAETFKRYPPDGLLTTKQRDHDVDLDPDIIDPDPLTSDDCLNVSSPIHQFLIKKTLEQKAMNTGEDESSSSGLNGRLRPRKSATHSAQTNYVRSFFYEKSKKYIAKSKASPDKLDDLSDKSDTSSTLNFLCPYCDKKFASKQTVSKHSRRLHLSTSKESAPISCLFCNHTESEPNDIIRHMVHSHPNQYFACFDCHTRFSSTSELAKHKLSVCEKQKPYRSKLRQKTTIAKKNSQKLNPNCKSGFRSNCKEYSSDSGYNGVVISCELKPSQVHDAADIEDNITTNLILPPNKNIGNASLLEKNAVIVLDDIQWNKRLPPNFTFHNTDADQILSRLGVIHRTPRTGEGTRRDWFKTIEDSTQKFEKCFDTSFYAQVASNVHENLSKFLDGTFNFNPDAENAIKTRKSKNSVIINTVEGFPILLNCEQYSRSISDGNLPRSIAPKYKSKWGSLDNEKTLTNSDQLKCDSHKNNCIITLVSSLDIWTQLCMRRKFEDKFCHSLLEKKAEQRNLIDKELKDILESRELPATSSQVVKHIEKPALSEDLLEFPVSLGLSPLATQYEIQPAVLSGEWVRPRSYVCCACGAQTRDARALTAHITTQHPNAQVQHYEIVGESLLNADILKHLYVPPIQPTNRTRPFRGFRVCTKCKTPASLEDLHQHMLDCSGDTPTVRRKCRYRPFGVRRRRPRLPDNTIRKKIRKDIRNRQTQKGYMNSRTRPRIKTEVGDAETIRKMIADLPAKRHRVMINPLNAMLRPRRKFELQRNSLLAKRRPSDDPENRKLRTKDVSNSMNFGESSQKKLTSRENNKPMRVKMKHLVSKSGNLNESFKRSTVFNRPKRSVKKTNSAGNEIDLTESGNDDPPDQFFSPDDNPDSGSKKQEPSDSPQKVDLNGGPYKIRERAGGHEGTNSSGSGSNSKDGESDPGGEKENTGDGGHNPNDDRSNNSNGSSNDRRENDDKSPVQNTPLKHSIARLTANYETHDKSVQFHHLFLVQQECNNITEHAPTEQRELFENEAVVTKLDKPPLHYPKGASELIALQKSKMNKPRKGLNDCIAMLKNKLVDPLPRPMIGQVSVQCGDDEPIEPVHYSQRTILESGINMTPAQIFYRPMLTQATLSNRCNAPNVVSYSYPAAQTIISASRAEKPKVRQKKYPQGYEKTLFKQKQDESLIQRKSMRTKAEARGDIKMKREFMHLPSQIEIIPQRSENIRNIKSTMVYGHKPHQSTEPVAVVNQQKVNELVSTTKRRGSFDLKIQQKETLNSLLSVQPESDIIFDNDWSKRQTMKRKSIESIAINQSANQPESSFTEQMARKTPKDKYQSSKDKCQSPKDRYPSDTADTTSIACNENYSEPNYNILPPGIPAAHLNTAVDPILLAPLDLSGKSVQANESENILLGDDLYYNSSYDSNETLDLSNKKLDYLMGTPANFVTDIVVDLSTKPVEHLTTEPAHGNIYGNTSVDVIDFVTDLSTSRHEIDNCPTDLSLRVNEIISSEETYETLSYGVHDLSRRKVPTSSEKSISYLSEVKDVPTDLSNKTSVETSTFSNFSSVLEPYDNVLRESLDLSKNNEFPADLSAKNLSINNTILPSINNAVSDRTTESTQSAIGLSSLLSFADKQHKVTLQPKYNNFIKKTQYTNDDTSKTEATVVIDGTLNPNISMQSSESTCNRIQLLPIQAYEPNVNCSNIVMQEIRNSSQLSVQSQERTHYGYDLVPVTVTVSTSAGCIPLYTLPNPIGKYENTKPVYTLENACLPMTKIETTNVTTFTNTSLSTPETKIANSTSIYTLAGALVGSGTPMNYQKVPHTVNDSSHSSKNINLCQSSLSSSYEATRAANNSNVSMKGANEFEKGASNAYSEIAADLDPDSVSKIAMLPKEIVEILGTMPIDHRKQLLNILPQYVTTSTTALSLHGKNSAAKPDELSSLNIIPNRKSPYLQVQTADSTSGSKSCNNMEMEDDYYQSHLHTFTDVKLIPLPTTTPPPLPYEIVPDDTEIVHCEQTQYGTETKDNDCIDIKTIDLTQDENVDVLSNTITEVNDADQTLAVPASSAILKGNKYKNNEQTASLRAVRIKTPSERLKVVSSENQFLLQNQVITTNPSSVVEDNKIYNKPFCTKEKKRYLTVTTQVDSPLQEKNHDESNKNASEYKTRAIDVDQHFQQKHGINATLNYSLGKTSDAQSTHSSDADMSINNVNENIGNTSPIEISEGSPRHSSLNTTINLDHDVSVLSSTNKKEINSENDDHTGPTSSVNIEKPLADEDDSEDDILLAVILKQKREKQVTDQIKKETKQHCSSKSIKQTEVPLVTPTVTEKKSKKHVLTSTFKRSLSKSNKNDDQHELQVLDKEQSADSTKTNESENSKKPTKEQINQKTNKGKLNTDKETTVYQIKKVDMGVQYECLDKALYDQSDTMIAARANDQLNTINTNDQCVDNNINQRSDNIAVVENERYGCNKKDLHSIHDVSSTTINCEVISNSNKQKDEATLETMSKLKIREQSKVDRGKDIRSTIVDSGQVEEAPILLGDNVLSNNGKVLSDTKKTTSNDSKKITRALNLGSDTEEKTQIPLRRSRRGKSMFVKRRITIAYGDEDIAHAEVPLEQKTPLTKKQLIFSKLLLDAKNLSHTSTHRKFKKDSNIHQDSVNNLEKGISDVIPKNVTIVEGSAAEKDNTKKRTKSSQTTRKIKTKSSMIIDANDSDDLIESAKISKMGSDYTTNTEAIKEYISASNKITNILKQDKCNRQLKSQLTPEHYISDIASNDNNKPKKKLTSTEKRNRAGTSDLTFYSKMKRIKEKSKSETVTIDYLLHNNISKEGTSGQINKAVSNTETKTTCYNRPIASKRTRSKSAIVKPTEKEFIYDPYDIELDDMIADAKPIQRKRPKSDKIIPSIRVQKLIDIPSTSNSKEIRNREPSPVIRKKIKKSIKHRDRLRREKHIKEYMSDSDDSAKSDVPLTKYVKDREKRTRKPCKVFPDGDDYRNLSDDALSDKQSDIDSKNTKRMLVNCNNPETSSSHDETEERLKSEQFMESFGFFSERKPRKSNLLAAKKISETFHIIANESDDAYVGYRERAIKRALHNENKKAKQGECSRSQGPSNARKATRRGGRKKKFCIEILRYFCSVCKKEFRRPDNYLRHQLTLIHISRLSEELKIKMNPMPEEPNYLIVYKQHIDRLKIVTDKLAKKKNTSKLLDEIILPTLTEVLVEVNRVVREQLLSRRCLSRDEELFLDCCELLKESHMSDGDPISNYRCPQATMSGLALIEKQIDDDDSGDEPDPVVAHNILEGDEMRNLENDLISSLKEAANANNVHNMNCPKYKKSRVKSKTGPIQEVKEVSPNPNHCDKAVNKLDNLNEPSTSKVKKPEVKRMMYPDIIEDIDMFEDKFDKIKRKCRSQAAAAKQIQNVVEPLTSKKTRKKVDKKKVKQSSKKKHQVTQVPTKGALKGFDSVKGSISQSEPSKCVITQDRSKKKKKKKSCSKKKKEIEPNNKNEADNRTRDSSSFHKKVDVYEFLDSEDAELFEFRPSTLMERFKSINNRPVPSTSKISPPMNHADNSCPSVSDGDDFVYISDDYVGSDNETENSMSCDVANTKNTTETKKTVSPLKRKETVEKNAVMGKIFKHNAVRTEKKHIKYKEIPKLTANMDQLFDSLLEEEPILAVDSKLSNNSEHCSTNVPTAAFEVNQSLPNVLSPTKSLKDCDLKLHKTCDNSLMKYNEYIESTPSTSQIKDDSSPFKTDNNTEPEKSYDITHSTIHNTENIGTSLKYHENSPKSDKSLISVNLKEKYKKQCPLNKTEKDTGNIAKSFDQIVYDDISVARQRARRKCTVGKQKVLAETWSSESEPDGAPPRPNSTTSNKSDSGRKKRGRKREGHHSSGRRGNNRAITFKKHDEARVSSGNRNIFLGGCRRSTDDTISQGGESTSKNPGGTKWLDNYRSRDERPSGSGMKPHKSARPVVLSNTPAPSTSKVRPRPSSYYWSSDGDDEQEHPQQHGWIVGDSHKKLVTMLAHAKGRKRNNDEKRHLVE